MKRKVLAFLIVIVTVLGFVAPLVNTEVRADSEVEVVGLRTETSRTVRSADGYYHLYSFQTPIHYWDNGWQPINNEISNDVMDEDSYTFRVLQPLFNQGQIVEFSSQGEFIKFQPMALEWLGKYGGISQISMPTSVSGVVSNEPQPSVANKDYKTGTIRWDDAYGEGRHFEWTTAIGNLGKILQLDSKPPNPPQYMIDQGDTLLRLNFIFAPSELDIYVDGAKWDKSTRKVTVNQIEFKSGNQTLWYFVPVKYWDSAGNEAYGQTELRRSGQNLWVSALVPYEWLQIAVYPVFIDPSLSVFSSTSDGYIQYFAAPDYNTAWAATSGTGVLNVSTGSAVGQYYNAMFPWYHIYRSYLFFDTSSIFADNTVTSGALFLYGFTDESTQDFDITIGKGTSFTYPHDPLEAGDYNKANYNTTSLGSLSTAGWVVGDYNNITLNSAGLAWVNTTGLSKCIIRSSRDISGTAPTVSGQTEQVSWSTVEVTGTSQDPYLYVEYASPPTVETDACSDIQSTSVQANGEITSTGGESPHTRGFCYKEGTSGDPTTADSKVYDNGGGSYGVGAYSKSISGLDSSTSYRVRAYAINSIGTGYGTTVTVLTCPAAPTNVLATDGDYTDKVVVNWTKSIGATGYKVYEGSNLLDTLGDVDSYDDTSAPAPTITPGTATASDGDSTANVTLSLAGEGTNNGTTRTYKVVAFNDGGDSPDSDTDTGYRGIGALSYQWYYSDNGVDYSILTDATSDPWDDTTAPQGTITPGTASATDGNSPEHITLSLADEATADGDERWYKCLNSAEGAESQYSTIDTGYRTVGELNKQWQVSAGDSDENYSNITGATSDPYNYSDAPPPTITAGNTTASDGTSTEHVTLDLTNQLGNNGDGRHFQCVLGAEGAVSQNSSSDRGYRGIDNLVYQWQRSAGDSDDDYSDIAGATADPYNDTGAPANGDGRYYQCTVNMTGAISQNSTPDRGYRLVVVIPTVTCSNATEVGPDYATLWGDITDTGYENPFTRGFEWGLSIGNYTFNWTQDGSFGLGAFSHQITELASNTTYFWRAFAINSAGQGNSTVCNFTTMIGYPFPPGNFTATQLDINTIGLTWDMGYLADNITIMVSTMRFPANLSEGYLAYSGNGTSCNLTGVTIGEFNTYYFSAWSENEAGYSLTYATAQIGGNMQDILMFGLLFLMAGIFVGFYLWKREMWLGIAAGVAWVAIGIYAWFGYVAPTDEMTTMWFGLGWLFLAIGLALLVAPMTWRRTKDEVWEEGTDEDDGEPIMEQYVNGNLTGKRRPLTDRESRERMSRLREQEGR